MRRDRRVERVEKFAAVIIAVGTAHNGFERLEAGEVHPDTLADLRGESR
jgi:hypothetical protein